MAKHLNSLNEQFFSVKDWIAAVFRIVESDRMSEQRISDEYAHPLPANFVPTAKQDTSASRIRLQAGGGVVGTSKGGTYSSTSVVTACGISMASFTYQNKINQGLFSRRVVG
jgi:hypothetical protein